MNLEQLKLEWAETSPRVKWIYAAVIVAGVVFVGARAMRNSAAPASPADASGQKAATANDPAFHTPAGVLPGSPRNQGLEDMQKRLDEFATVLQRVEANQQRYEKADAARVPASGAGSGARAGMNLEAPIAAPSWDVPASGAALAPALQAPGANPGFVQPGARNADAPAPGGGAAPAELPEVRHMKVWADETPTLEIGDTGRKGLIIPINSALEGVMLSGINARPSGSVSGAVGSAVSANNVGAPFVTRIKGDAILPNGWKLGDLGDCLLGGSGVAVLSTERAYVIADSLSCIAPNGDVYESPVKAYGLDVDGTLGVAGKVVSKQGALLLQAALSGVASGLGAALAPTTISAYNTNATNGSTAGVQYPNPGTVAYTAVGQGINQAAGQLSKFYLDYAREVFPVVEVVSGTRVTWVLKETIELHKRVEKVAAR